MVTESRDFSAASADRFFLRRGARVSAYESKWTAVWVRTVGRQNLDRGFYLHNVPRTVSDDQRPDERTAKAAGKERRASGFVQCRSGEGHTGGFASLRGEATSRIRALGFSDRTKGRDLQTVA